jgi:hypothetical protein
LAGFHITCVNQPGFLLDRRIGTHRHQFCPHTAPTAHTLGRPTLTPGWTGPQVMPDSLDMLAGDCMHGALYAHAEIRAGGACMPAGHRTPG